MIICGIDQEGTCNLDFWIFSMDNKIEESIFTLEGAVIQQIQGVHSGRWSMEQTIFDKLNLTTDLPYADHKTYLNTIVKDYCMKRVWTDSLIINNISHLLPSSKSILNNELNSISNQDLIESFNELAAYYAQMAIKDLDLNHIRHPLLNACRSLASTLHSEPIVTWNSTHLRLIQLIERFPCLKPFLIILNKYSLHLKDILSGEKNGLDIFLTNDEIGQIFHSICQYLQLQYEQQIKDNSFENYRLRIFWLSDSNCSDVLPILDLFLNLSQQTGLLIDLHYVDSDPIQLANAQEIFNTHLTNQTNLSIIYDETIDLYDIHISHYFHLIFGFFDQWWSSSSDDDNDNNRALSNIQQWTTLLKQIQEFNIIESTLNQNESTFIISQKTISNDILQTLDERINQIWLIFTKDDQNNKNILYSKFDIK
ncbi:unnamed protein product [Adineta steineri]|uniref:Uncharacterized protein n=1 Tax=Adineta steineri TaxID=433720 RepID=A0A813YIX7_9BILA|nr:unnamed protein product [Adineta steineri]CAF1102840.1 unnamed protein product [Adineta steineri]CAF3892968.1 unnamed protein product [Adineta steineri]CAF4019783.1 unnamed protein product [Adineta steineri]